jgi:hypothetical protein
VIDEKIKADVLFLETEKKEKRIQTRVDKTSS